MVVVVNCASRELRLLGNSCNDVEEGLGLMVFDFLGTVNLHLHRHYAFQFNTYACSFMHTYSKLKGQLFKHGTTQSYILQKTSKYINVHTNFEVIKGHMFQHVGQEQNQNLSFAGTPHKGWGRVLQTVAMARFKLICNNLECCTTYKQLSLY